MVTGGRTRPRGERYFDLIDVVARTGRPGFVPSFSPERTLILDLCRNPVTVADLASAMGLPLGVVRVLLDDLVQEDLIDVTTAAPRGRPTDAGLLKQVLDALHALLSRTPRTRCYPNAPPLVPSLNAWGQPSGTWPLMMVPAPGPDARTGSS
jgi:hypothetical protein